jgi:hypothetical protein
VLTTCSSKRPTSCTNMDTAETKSPSIPPGHTCITLSFPPPDRGRTLQSSRP